MDLWRALIFFNIPKTCCVLWKFFPSWHLERVASGVRAWVIPDSGFPPACAGVVRRDVPPCYLLGEAPLSLPSSAPACKLVPAVLAIAASLAAASEARAQQYHYPVRGYQAPTYYT